MQSSAAPGLKSELEAVLRFHAALKTAAELALGVGGRVCFLSVACVLAVDPTCDCDRPIPAYLVVADLEKLTPVTVPPAGSFFCPLYSVQFRKPHRGTG